MFSMFFHVFPCFFQCFFHVFSGSWFWFNCLQFKENNLTGNGPLILSWNSRKMKLKREFGGAPCFENSKESLNTSQKSDLIAWAYGQANVWSTDFLSVLVDEDLPNRFKSKQGLDAPETPRDISFVGMPINQRRVYSLFPDASVDERFFWITLLVTQRLQTFVFMPLPFKA